MSEVDEIMIMVMAMVIMMAEITRTMITEIKFNSKGDNNDHDNTVIITL